MKPQPTPKEKKASCSGEQVAAEAERRAFEPMHSDLNLKRGLMAAESGQHPLKAILVVISFVVIAVVPSVQGDVEQAVSRPMPVVVAAVVVLGDLRVPCSAASVVAEAAIATLQY